MIAQSAEATLRPRWWSRELTHYPDARVRYVSLAMVVLATIVLYYQLYLSGGVAVQIMGSYGISFRWFVTMNVVSLASAAIAAHFGGLTDRFGRANVITTGLVVVGLLSTVAVPLCHGRWSFAVVFGAINSVEGVILVATPAVMRDFSPQLGRASAMGFWTMGPVLGSLVVHAVVGSTTTGWQHQYVVAGIAGLVIAALSLAFLKELSPTLRDQVMVEEKDRALVEARIHGIDVEVARGSAARQMFKPDVILSSIAISIFLLFYISMVAFGPTYFEVVFGYTPSKANSVLVWGWVFNVGGLVLCGWLSDKLLVRKPLMLLGAAITLVMIIAFTTRATHPHTSYATFATILAGLFFFAGMAYVAWMAAFTETVERRNPALTATGLAVWGLTIRVLFAAFIFVAPNLVNTVNPIIDHGAAVQQIAAGDSPDLDASQNEVVAAVAKDPTIVTKVKTLAAAYVDQLKTAAVIDPATQRALAANPTDPAAGARAVGEIAKALHLVPTEAMARLVALAKVPKADLAFLNTYGASLQNRTVVAKLQYLQKYGPEVRKAAADGPRQWRSYFWITAAGALAFIPTIWFMAGFWTPRRAREALHEHEAAVAAELAT
jgi:MFS family permease